MRSFYTGKGDDGYTGRLGEGRIPKYHPVTEAVGAVDEATAALGMARASAQDEAILPILSTIQRELYRLMTEISATPENAARFRKIDASRVAWLEEQTDFFTSQVEMPRDFILPGDSPGGAALAFARTVVRRAERNVARLWHEKQLENADVLRYLNRLSSLCFAMELYENHAWGKTTPTLAKQG